MPDTYTITINPGCSPTPPSVTCQPGDQICFLNKTGGTTTIVFTVPPGSPLAPPTIGPISNDGTGCGRATGVRGTFRYHCQPSAGAQAGGGDDGGGIIIVDPGMGGSGAAQPKPSASAKAAAKRPKAKPKTKPKAKPKAKGKAKPKGKGKAKGGKKAASKRKAGKGRSKKK